MSNRLDQEREKILTPKRLQHAYETLDALGYEIYISECEKKLTFDRKPNKTVVLFVYTGWWSGKGIGSGRGLNELIKTMGHGL
jgi:hypothetical protein